jgi:hypothetical protein
MDTYTSSGSTYVHTFVSTSTLGEGTDEVTSTLFANTDSSTAPSPVTDTATTAILPGSNVTRSDYSSNSDNLVADPGGDNGAISTTYLEGSGTTGGITGSTASDYTSDSIPSSKPDASSGRPDSSLLSDATTSESIGTVPTIGGGDPVQTSQSITSFTYDSDIGAFTTGSEAPSHNSTETSLISESTPANTLGTTDQGGNTGDTIIGTTPSLTANSVPVTDTSMESSSSASGASGTQNEPQPGQSGTTQEQISSQAPSTPCKNSPEFLDYAIYNICRNSPEFQDYAVCSYCRNSPGFLDYAVYSI